jgi:DNA-binding NarL/FixJ family response regulator
MIRLLSYTTSSVMVVGLRAFLSDARDVELHVVSTDIDEFTQAAAKANPDVMLIESNPEIHIGTLAGLRRRLPAARMILWVQGISLEMAHALRELGVCGILRKNVPLDLTLRCIRQVAAGEIWFERALINEFNASRKIKLSNRERQLMTLISRGYSNLQIAESLALAEGTVSVYLSKLFKKVGVGDRYELAMYGLRSMAMIDAESSANLSAPELWAQTLFIRGGAGRRV